MDNTLVFDDLKSFSQEVNLYGTKSKVNGRCWNTNHPFNVKGIPLN